MTLTERGDPTGVPCPRCGAEIVYGGNYLCSRWAWRPDAAVGECDWALGWDEEGLPASATDLAIWNELRARYDRLRDYLADHPEEDVP